MTVEFGNEKATPTRRQRVASKQVSIKVRIEPLGWAKNAEAFETAGPTISYEFCARILPRVRRIHLVPSSQR